MPPPPNPTSCGLCNEQVLKLRDHVQRHHHVTMAEYRRRLEPPTSTAGIQPQINGRVICLICGRGFRSLGQHLRRKHQTSTDKYRDRYELPATLALVVPQLSERLAAQGRDLVARHPAVRAAFARAQQPARVAVTAARGRAAGSRTAARRGVQLRQRARGAFLAMLSQRRATQRRAILDARARDLGHRNFVAALHATSDIPAKRLGPMLGLSPAMVTWWRGQHQIRSTAKAAATRERRALAATPLDPAGTPQTSVQPVRQDGYLRCLECGDPAAWYENLAAHVAQGHRLPPAQYRRRHRLPTDTSLQSDRLTVAARTSAAAAGAKGRESAAAANRAKGRRRWDIAAKSAGYRDIADMLACLDNDAFTERLGIERYRASRLRRRYSSPPDQDTTPA